MYIIKILENKKEVTRRDKFDACVSTTGYEILIERVFLCRKQKHPRKEKQAERGNCGAICFNLEYQPRIVAHESVQPHPAWNIARLKRETPPSARELSPPPIRRINLYAALRNQAKEATLDARCSAPCRVLGKRPRLYADRDETEGWKLCFILIRVWARDVFRQGARARLDRENEKDGKYGHVGRKWQGDSRESKPKVVGGRIDIKPRLPFLLSRSDTRGFRPLNRSGSDFNPYRASSMLEKKREKRR